MVGSGEKLSRCGAWVHLGCIEGAHQVLDSKNPRFYVESHPYRCDRPLCPECYSAWAFKRAGVAEKRYQEFLRIVNRRPSKRHHFWLLHVVVEGTQDRKLILRIMKRIGVKGGVLISHPWRKLKGEKWRYSPHWHILGIGWIDPLKQKQAQKKYNVFIKNIKPGQERDWFSTLSYQLTHCLAMKGTHAFTWWGCMAYNKYASPIELKEKAVCPHCGGILVPVIFVGPVAFEGLELGPWKNPDWFIYKDSGEPPPQ